ncbi:MAG: hypothetical protein ACO20Y_08940 [Poseidonia sp.]
MNNYEKKFHLIGGQKFRADVYDVLKAFGVTCAARAHAIKKLLMPGQRGAKDELQDLDEALVSVSRAIDMAQARMTEGGTLTDEREAPPYIFTREPEPKPKPNLVTWRWCVRMEPGEIGNRWFRCEWHPSGNIPNHWYPIESYEQPIETVQQLPEGQEP